MRMKEELEVVASSGECCNPFYSSLLKRTNRTLRMQGCSEKTSTVEETTPLPVQSAVPTRNHFQTGVSAIIARDVFGVSMLTSFRVTERKSAEE
jgi:hypothetical protein